MSDRINSMAQTILSRSADHHINSFGPSRERSCELIEDVVEQMKRASEIQLVPSPALRTASPAVSFSYVTG